MRVEIPIGAALIPAIGVAGLLFCVSPAKAQGTAHCGNGVELRLSAPVAAQGGLLLLEVRSKVSLADVEAHWGEKKLAFWQAEGTKAPAKVETNEAPKAQNTTGGEDARRALVGVDLEHPAGRYALKLTAKPENGADVSCNAAVTVRAGHFAVERLQVEPKFVQPSPEDLARAEKERLRLREIFATVTPTKLWEGSFRLPLDGARPASNFGRRRVLNGQPGSPHGGADFPAPTGTPVYAAQGGRIVVADALYFSGNTVVIDHGLGVYTFYGHLSSVKVKEGDVVKRGDLIGEVGATGRVTGPHLHWGLTVEGARVNPVQILSLLRRYRYSFSRPSVRPRSPRKRGVQSRFKSSGAPSLAE